jgi:hypothetical protein
MAKVLKSVPPIIDSWKKPDYSGLVEDSVTRPFYATIVLNVQSASRCLGFGAFTHPSQPPSSGWALLRFWSAA